MNVHPAILTTSTVRLQGVSVETTPNGFRVRARGKTYLEMTDPTIRTDGTRWTARGHATIGHPSLRSLDDGPQTVLIERAARGCAKCSGPKIDATSVEQRAELEAAFAEEPT